MKRSEFLKSVAVMPFVPFVMPLGLNDCPFDAQALVSEIEAVIVAAVDVVGSSTDTLYAATGEKVIAYALDSHPKYVAACSKHSIDGEKYLCFSMRGRMNVVVENAIKRGGPNPVTLYWRQKPTITRSPDRAGYWRFTTRFLVSKKIRSFTSFMDTYRQIKEETIRKLADTGCRVIK